MIQLRKHPGWLSYPTVRETEAQENPGSRLAIEEQPVDESPEADLPALVGPQKFKGCFV